MELGPDDPVRAVTAFDPICAAPGDDLAAMARLMAEHNCGALLVNLHGGGVALVSERDVVRALAADNEAAWAVDVMARQVIEISPDDSIADAAELMLEAGVRHLLVRDELEDGALRLGIVSVRDLIDPILNGLP